VKQGILRASRAYSSVDFRRQGKWRKGDPGLIKINAPSRPSRATARTLQSQNLAAPPATLLQTKDKEKIKNAETALPIAAGIKMAVPPIFGWLFAAAV
jgi:hypothetical protein